MMESCDRAGVLNEAAAVFRPWRGRVAGSRNRMSCFTWSICWVGGEMEAGDVGDKEWCSLPDDCYIILDAVVIGLGCIISCRQKGQRGVLVRLEANISAEASHVLLDFHFCGVRSAVTTPYLLTHY